MMLLALATISDMIQSQLKDMINQGITKFLGEFILDETHRTQFKFEVTRSGEDYDAVIVITDYYYLLKKQVHTLKLSISARRCISKKRLNPNAPQIRVTIRGFVNEEGEVCMAYDEIAQLESGLSAEISTRWFNTL